MTELDFDSDQPNDTLASIYAAARGGGRRVLQVGEVAGLVADRLTKADGFEVARVDADLDATWWEPLAGETWDTVVLAGVLDRVREPARMLRAIKDGRLMAENGSLVLSFPNAAHQAVLAELLSGDFRYEQVGLLDERRVRWFTLESMTRLLESSGFVVLDVRRTLLTLDETPRAVPSTALTSAAREALDELGLEGRTSQYVLRARPTSEAARFAALHDQVDSQRRELLAVQQRLEQTERLLVAEREHVRAELSAGAKELAQVEARLAKAERRAARSQADSKSGGQLKARQDSKPIVRLGRKVARRAVKAARDPKTAARRLRSRLSR